MKKIAVIGSTGSIGRQTLEVVRRNPDKFKIVALSAGANADLFIEQVKEFKPQVATLAVQEESVAERLKGLKTELFFGKDAYKNAIGDFADVALIALVGFTGLAAVTDAINKGVSVALANKESLVVGGETVMPLAKEKGVFIAPVDSEHSALWQCLSFDFNKPFERLIITASGGAFRDMDEKRLKTVTAADALKHPNWNMGAKITVDCATLVNKAYEVIEAHWLYSAPYDKIDVIIHRESVIHSMVEYKDGSVIAQMSYPTMELPISLALSYPDRLNCSVKRLDFASLGKLSFEAVDKNKYPCFDLILGAAEKGGVYGAVANGANDRAVELFLKGQIAFNDIYGSIDGALSAFGENLPSDADGYYAANAFATRFVNRRFGIK